MSYRVNLDIFRGPLDLLLYLVRKHEVDITEIPVATITESYLEHLEILRELDVNSVGEFLVMATTLMEIKSRELLPRGGEVEEELEDPRQDLVRHLLEYKKFRDASSMLDERSRTWRDRFGRRACDLPPRKRDLAEEPIREVELWDLVSAFGRIMKAHQVVQPSNIVYDDTPIHVYMQRIHDRLRGEGKLSFDALFDASMHKSTLIGMFLAILELVRHHAVQVEQEDLFGQLWVHATDAMTSPGDYSQVSDYEHPTHADDEPEDDGDSSAAVEE